MAISKSTVIARAPASTHLNTIPDVVKSGVKVAESYAPAVAGNWTGSIGAPAAPTTQDGALDSLAAISKALAVMTAAADMIVGGTSGVPARLAKGAAYSVLAMNSGATAQAWSLIADANVSATAEIAVSKLAHGTANHVLKTDGTDVAYGFIVNANVDASAAIATSKLAGDSVATNKVDGLVKCIRGKVTAAQLVTATSGVAKGIFGATSIPDNSIIVGGFVDVITTFAGNGDDSSTISIGLNSGVDVVAAVAIKDGGNPWDAGLHDVIPDSTGSTALKLSAARDLSVTWTAVATDTTLAAGEMDIVLFYIVGS